MDSKLQNRKIKLELTVDESTTVLALLIKTKQNPPEDKLLMDSVDRVQDKITSLLFNKK